MRVLLDECIDRRLARELGGHDVRTVQQMGWTGLQNGALLRAAEKDFDTFVTVDRNLSAQQNLSVYALAVVVLRSPSNRLKDLRLPVPDLLATLADAPAGRATFIDPAHR